MQDGGLRRAADPLAFQAPQFAAVALQAYADLMGGGAGECRGSAAVTKYYISKEKHLGCEQKGATHVLWGAPAMRRQPGEPLGTLLGPGLLAGPTDFQ